MKQTLHEAVEAIRLLGARRLAGDDFERLTSYLEDILGEVIASRATESEPDPTFPGFVNYCGVCCWHGFNSVCPTCGSAELVRLTRAIESAERQHLPEGARLLAFILDSPLMHHRDFTWYLEHNSEDVMPADLVRWRKAERVRRGET